MFSERFGADTLATQKADQKAAVKKDRKDRAANKPTGDTAAAVKEDPGRFFKDLFLRLVEAETVDADALIKLANVRAQRIVSELIDVGKLPAERIKVKPSAPVDNKEEVSAVLSLEAGN